MNRYYTQSSNLAAYLVMNGFEMIDSEQRDGKVTIYFEKSDELHDCVRKYNTETKLKEFIASFKKVKDFIKYRK